MQLKMHLSQIPGSQLKERGELLQLWDYQTKLLPKHKAPGNNRALGQRGGRRRMGGQGGGDFGLGATTKVSS